MICGAGRGGIFAYHGGSHAGELNVNSCTLWNNGNTTIYGGGVVWKSINSGTSQYNIYCHNVISLENDGGSSCADFNETHSSGTAPQNYDVSYSIDSDNSISTKTDGGTGNLASRTATDNTSPGAGDWVIFEDITSAPYDFRIVDNAENDAQDMHSTATAHGITIPSTDIVGTSRPQNTDYECGAFEIVSAVPAEVDRLLLLGVS
jgi:hypothetical protein